LSTHASLFVRFFSFDAVIYVGMKYSNDTFHPCLLKYRTLTVSWSEDVLNVRCFLISVQPG